MILFTNAEKILLSKTNIDYRVANKEDIIENFTLRNLDTQQETENQNVVTKSQILAPFNSTLKKLENWKLESDLKIENEVMKMCGKVKEAIRNYELNNNGEIDNGFLINLENQYSQNNNNEKSDNYNTNHDNNNNDLHIHSKPNSKVNSCIASKASLNSQNNDLYNKIKFGSSKNSNTNSNPNLNLKMNNSLEDDNYAFNNKLSKKSTNSRENLVSYQTLVISRIF